MTNLKSSKSDDCLYLASIRDLKSINVNITHKNLPYSLTVFSLLKCQNRPLCSRFYLCCELLLHFSTKKLECTPKMDYFVVLVNKRDKRSK